MNAPGDRYGYFSGDHDRYVITTPNTPDAWFNYLFNDDYLLRVSQRGQGKSWLRLPRIRMHNRELRAFYVCDRDSGICWNLNHSPMNVGDQFACTHTLGYTQFDTRCDGLAGRLRVFVPRSGQREIWTVTLRNESKQPRKVGVYSLLSLEKSDPMGARCYYDEAVGAILHTTFPHHAFYDDGVRLGTDQSYLYVVTNRAHESVECSQRRFFGTDDTSVLPAAIRAGRCSGQLAEWHDPVGAYQHVLALEPGGSATFSVVLGAEKTPAEVAAVKARYGDPQAVEDEWAAVEQWWEGLCNRLIVRTPDADFDAFMNYWLKKEIVWETRLWRNGISVPYRNELQDAMGYSLFDAPGAWPFLEELLAAQEADGHFKVWNTRPNHAPNHPLVNLSHNDGGIWLTICLCAFVEQGGDLSVLDHEVAFKDGGSASVYEHVVRAVRHTSGLRGAHGLVLMLGGDWTDPINGPGRGGRGESVWGSMALIYAAGQLARLAERRSDPDVVTELRALTADLTDAINAHAWMGSWYCYGFDDEGKPFGTPDDNEGRIYLNVQSWAILSGVATSDRLDGCLAAIDRLDTPCGPRLIWPEFSSWNDTVGRLSVKLAGSTENGSVYCHGSSFKAFADCLRGDGKAAYDTIRRTLPTNPDNPPEKNLQVPIFQANHYFGLVDSPNFGHSSQTLGTGTCTWLLLAAVEGLLGVKATVDGVVVDPHLPDDWPGATVERAFRDARYVVRISRGTKAGIVVDGQPLEGNVLPYESGRTFEVTVTV